MAAMGPSDIPFAGDTKAQLIAARAQTPDTNGAVQAQFNTCFQLPKCGHAGIVHISRPVERKANNWSKFDINLAPGRIGDGINKDLQAI